MKVCKFGGTSLADGGQILKICRIMEADKSRRVVVVSAPGKRHAGDTKVTDLLIAAAETALRGESTAAAVVAVVERYSAIQQELQLDAHLSDEIAADLQRRIDSDCSNADRFLDLIKAAGEDYSARIVAAVMQSRGIAALYLNPATAGMLLEGEAGNATLCPAANELLAERVSAALQQPEQPIVVFPGFFGARSDGSIATFPRGGSDITGAILAAALKAESYENFTDVDTVYAVDPRLVPEVHHGIHEMTYREMRELAYAGFGVFHDEAVIPAFRASIPINIRNTNHPELPGSWILPQREAKTCSVVGIASDAGFVAIYVDKYMMNRELGFGRRLLQILEEEGVSFEHMPTGIDNISVVMRDINFPPAREARVVERIKAELKPDAVLVERDHALVMVVGEGMQYAVGMASRATTALARAKVNIEMINQGASEISIMFGVRSPNRVAAVRALYQEFFSDPPGAASPCRC